MRIRLRLNGRTTRQSIDPGAHRCTCDQPLRHRLADAFIPRLAVGDVLPHLFLCRLRHFLEDAFLHAADRHALADIGRFRRQCCAGLDAIAERSCCKCGIHVWQTKLRRQSPTGRANNPGADAGANCRTGRAQGINGFVRLFHLLTGCDCAFADTACNRTGF